MVAASFFFLLFGGILGAVFGYELESSSVLGIQDSITSLKQMVLQLEDRMSSLETSIPQTIKAANVEILLTILDKMAINLENYSKTDKVSEISEALRREFQELQSNHSLCTEQLEEKMAMHNDVAQINQNLRNQTLLINKFYTYLEDFQNSCTSEPPSPQNGMPVDFERKHGSKVGYKCKKNFFPTGNSTVRCNYGKWIGRPPVCTLFPNTFTLRAHFVQLHYAYSYALYNVSCSSGEDRQKMKFSRVLDTGMGAALHFNAKTYSRNTLAVLDLSGVGRPEKHGVYQCRYDTEGTRVGISLLIDRQGSFRPPTMASIGDNVELKTGLSENPSLRWLRDGKGIPAEDGKAVLTIASVRADDAGIYGAYVEAERFRDLSSLREYSYTQLIFRLVVRGCRANFFGNLCDQECTPCYNGGICHDKLGTCICPPGFEGSNCEVACGKGRFGSNCSETCDGSGCRLQVFCKPDPFGCSCAPGYKGELCTQNCHDGTFGADCKQTCHCARGPCSPYTGACASDCSPGWTGQSCQIPVGN